MSKIPEQELSLIEKIISDSQGEIRIDDILKHREIGLQRRTLQRRLNQLIEQGRLYVSGKGPGRKYQIPSTINEPYESFLIPLSYESRLIRAYINQPIEKRKSVNYNRQFLDGYIPNKTHYLMENQIEHLMKIGDHQFSNQLAGTRARRIFNNLLIDLSWNSSRLEGNTYSLLETERLLEFGEKSENKSATETQMILNHKAAIKFLVDCAEDITYNRSTILSLHALLSDNLLGNSESCGRLRNMPVSIGKTTYSPTNIPQLINEEFQKILDIACKIQNPFESAFFVMVHLPYLQPFEDVNKRVSRLSANISFIKENLSPISFVDVPEKAYIDGVLGVYELNKIDLLRDVFIWAYERSAVRYTAARQLLGEADPFRLKYRKQMSEVIVYIINHNLKPKECVDYLEDWTSKHIQENEQDRFREIVETELLKLHSGNIIKYRIKLSDFEKWQEQYNKPVFEDKNEM